MTADVFFGVRKLASALENRDVIVGLNYFGVRLDNGRVIFSRCALNKSVEGVRRDAHDIVERMKNHGVSGFRLRGGMRLRFTNQQLVFCYASEHHEELREELRQEFVELELTELNPPPVCDEREKSLSREVVEL